MANPFLRLLALALAAFTAFARAEEIPEIETIKAPYLRNLAAIKAASDARVQPLANSYAAALDRLAQDLTARNDGPGAEAAQAEKARVTAKAEPTPAERKMMPPALGQLRDRFDKDRERVDAPFQEQVKIQTRQYVSALETEQRRLVAQNQIQKAAAVGAERSAVLGKPAATEQVKEKKPIADSTVHREGKLDVEIGQKIAAAVSSKSFTRTENSGGTEKTMGWADIPEEGAILVGFEFMEVDKKHPWIRSLRPYFMSREAIVAGKDRGKMENVTDKVLARPGFAVAGLLTEAKTGLQVLFMKIDPSTGRFDANSANAYKSKWFGSKTREKPVQIGGSGALIIGVYGKTGADCDTLGLVELNAT